MEEIKVGEYIRTNNGHIGILKRIELDKTDKSLKWYVYDEKEFEINIIKERYINKPYIVKHSPNIIDLIEVGDYVNGYKVLDIMEDMETGEIHLEMTSDYTNEIIGDCTIYNDDIKTIVTHEQFSNIEYRLEN